MKANALGADNINMEFEAEIFNDILDVYIRASELADSGYEMYQMVDEDFNDCIYTYINKTAKTAKFKFLFKNTQILRQLKIAGLDEDEIQRKITHDCIHFIYMAEESNVSPLAKKHNISEIDAMRMMLPECYQSNLGPTITWID